MNNLWYKLSHQDILRELRSQEDGLTTFEAQQRLDRYGLNKIPEAKVDSYPLILFRQFENPLIYLLLLSAIAIYFLHGIVDSLLIFFVLLFNAVVGTIQEGRAQHTLQALKQFLETKATVFRDHQKVILADSALVPGDIIWLQEGEKVPADARIISNNNLTIDESALSGESSPVHKIAETLRGENLPLIERKNMVYKGTHILSGWAKAVIVATGVNTQIGQISTEIQEHQADIPLKARIRTLSNYLILCVGVVSILLAILGIGKGITGLDMLSIVISLAVSVIPEGLPIVLTLILSTGVWRMSKRNALVKRIQAVEGLGEIDVIAIDKTGTITKNEMTVTEIWTLTNQFQVEGTGYDAKGKILLRGKIATPLQHEDLNIAIRTATFCANAHLFFSPSLKEWQIGGDPTEAALLVLAEKAGLTKEKTHHLYPSLRNFPFDYQKKYHANLNTIDEKMVLSVTGAPEVVMAHCHLTSGQIGKIKSAIEEYTSQGLRVVAFAWQDEVIDPKVDHLSRLKFGGLYAMKDPLHPEARTAILQVKKAGIRVILVTGDHQVTALAIAQEAGIFEENDLIINGKELLLLTEPELQEKLPFVTVFARVSPEQKMQIIQAYQDLGQKIAMTGDGVNDAPSLVAADLGIAMGKIGTEVAKEAADIILLDDNFTSIVAAIEEGRGIYKTIKKVLVYLFSTSIGEAFTLIGALLIGFPLPLQASQIIWLNFVTDGFLTTALAMEPKETGLLDQKNIGRSHLIDQGMAFRIVYLGVIMATITLLMFSFYYQENLVKAWTIALTTLAIVQWYQAWNMRSESQSVFRLKAWSSPYLSISLLAVFGLQILAVYHPLFQKLLHTTALNPREWAIIIVMASGVLLAEEVRKLLRHRLSPLVFT